MGRFIQQRAHRKDREVVDFESEAIRIWSAAKADADRHERTGQGERASKILDRARATCIDLFEGAMQAGKPGVAEIVAWYADLDPALRARAKAAYLKLHPRFVHCGR